MNILVINDDGIRAPGLLPLVRAAKEFGEVRVVAPLHQCSGMSMKLTIHSPMEVAPVPDFPVEGVHAFSIDGTPADCIKAAMWHCMPGKPDLVLSGINWGYNAGFDIAYSGTCGGAFIARMYDIPAMAFSTRDGGDYSVAEAWLVPMIRDLLSRPLADGDVWNVNFPDCPLSELQGVLYDRPVARIQMYRDNYLIRALPNGNMELEEHGILISREECPPGTDIEAIMDNYISVSAIHHCCY